MFVSNPNDAVCLYLFFLRGKRLRVQGWVVETDPSRYASKVLKECSKLHKLHVALRQHYRQIWFWELKAKNRTLQTKPDFRGCVFGEIRGWHLNVDTF